jgi:hypothetical protein
VYQARFEQEYAEAVDDEVKCPIDEKMEKMPVVANQLVR